MSRVVAGDSDRFIGVATVGDPLTAEAYAEALRRNGIPVLVHEARGGAVDMLTQPASDFWEIRVPETLLERAEPIIAEEASQEARFQAEAEQAAEDEALTGTPPE